MWYPVDVHNAECRRSLAVSADYPSTLMSADKVNFKYADVFVIPCGTMSATVADVSIMDEHFSYSNAQIVSFHFWARLAIPRLEMSRLQSSRVICHLLFSSVFANYKSSNTHHG